MKLLMVTAAYPYGHGESFVKAELDHVCAYFDEVEVVPCSFNAASAPRAMAQPLNLDYANKRWGSFRKFHLISSLAVALWKYNWVHDVFHIATHSHKFVNIKELVRCLYRARLFELFLKAQAAKNKKDFDLVYFYWIVPEIMGAIGYRKESGSRMRIVSRAHGGDLYEDRRAGGYVGLQDGIAAGIDDIFCISAHGKKFLDDKYPAMKGKFHTARLGVNDPGYLNLQPGDEALSIVSCSFVVAGKRLQLIADAIAWLLDRDPGLAIRWTHVGDGELYDQLRAYVERTLGGRAAVVFKGYLTQDQLGELYRNERFDVVVNVSDCEGIPVSLMEASAVSIPMVATDVGGTSEIVNAANGVLIPADADVATIGSAIIRFRDRAAAAACRSSARSQWRENFNARANYNAFGRRLVQLLEPFP
jgi:colanic acid/amylovoran biosynthesis glycosyltransferase